MFDAKAIDRILQNPTATHNDLYAVLEMALTGSLSIPIVHLIAAHPNTDLPLLVACFGYAKTSTYIRYAVRIIHEIVNNQSRDLLILETPEAIQFFQDMEGWLGNTEKLEKMIDDNKRY